MDEFFLEVTAGTADGSGQATIFINKDGQITHIRFGGPFAAMLPFDLDFEPNESLPQDLCLGSCLMQTIGYAHGDMITVIGTESYARNHDITVVEHRHDPRVSIESQYVQGYYRVHIGDQEATAMLGDLLAAEKALSYGRHPYESLLARN